MYKGTVSYPSGMTSEKWTRILGDMLFFVTTDYQNVEGGKTIYVTKDDKKRLDWRNDGFNVMNKKDCKRYFRGRKYLIVYFYNLWD